MTTYLVHLTGKNFLIDDGKGPRKKCFRSSRLVEAENHKCAETVALEFINKGIHFPACVSLPLGSALGRLEEFMSIAWRSLL